MRQHGQGGRGAGVSTPSVSEVIADLEHALGVRLLDRTTRGVVATLYGHALLKRGGAAFDELRQAINEIELLSDPTAGEVSVGCPESIASILPPVIEAFRRQYPRAILAIDHEIFLTFAPRLRDRSLDLVVMRMRGRSLSDGSVDDDLQSEIVFNDDLVIAAGKRSRWAHRRRVDLSDLHSADWSFARTAKLGDTGWRRCFPPPWTDNAEDRCAEPFGSSSGQSARRRRYLMAVSRSVLDFIASGSSSSRCRFHCGRRCGRSLS